MIISARQPATCAVKRHKCQHNVMVDMRLPEFYPSFSLKYICPFHIFFNKKLIGQMMHVHRISMYCEQCVYNEKVFPKLIFKGVYPCLF